MSLSVIDRDLLERCLGSAPRAWEDFVDRFLGLMIHVVNHTLRCRGLTLSREEREDLVAEIFAAIVANKYAVLRRFERNCSLATYLSVIARRIVVRKLARRTLPTAPDDTPLDDQGSDDSDILRLDDADEVEQLLKQLSPDDARVVKMYHLDGLSYREISERIGIPAGSIGPILSRARAKIRGAYPDPAR